MHANYNFLCCQNILDAILDENMALIMGANTLELFALPLSFPLSNDTRNTVLNPVSSFEWPWRIDNVSMTTRIQLSKLSGTYDSVGILLRFGSLFPWVRRCDIEKGSSTHIYSCSRSTFCINTNFMQTSFIQVPALSVN